MYVGFAGMRSLTDPYIHPNKAQQHAAMTLKHILGVNKMCIFNNFKVNHIMYEEKKIQKKSQHALHTGVGYLAENKF